jgi:outer membrane protein OmpA-like peptidoglycan-associated protein
VRLRDEALRPPSEVVVAPIDLRLRGISTAPGARSAVTLALRGKPGGTVRAEGTLSLEPPTAAGSLSIDVSEPGRLVPYFRDILAVDVPSGRMRASGRFRFEARPGGPRVVFSGISLDVAKLAVRGAGEGTFLRVPRFEARDTSIDVERRSVSIGPVTSRGGWVEIRREANGKLRLARLLRRSRDKPVGPDLPWTVHFARIDLSDWRGRYEDLHVTPPVHVTASGLAIRSTGLEVSPGWEGAGEVDVNIGDGSVHVAGSADIDPIALAFRVDVKDAPISPFQGYFARYVGALFTAGTVSAQARLALALVRKPVRDLRLDIAGNASLTGVAAVDAREGKPLVRWNALHLSGVSLKLLPLRLTVGDVTLEQPVVRIARGTDGTMNLGPFGKRDTARLEPKAVASTPRPRPVIAIGQVAVKGGRLFFADGAVRPPFIGELGHVEARITGLATDPRSRAAFELRSGVNRAAALGASGTLSVLAGPPSADARLGVRDLDLPPFSSYAAKYAGALVDKGKLDLSATCRIERGKLDVQSRLVIDQLQLSVAPQSPKAPRLQVRDAVALLKDRRGVIDLSVPVTGSLSDPSFRLGPAIQRAMGNVVTRVVTAPFALLGAAFGGSGREELSVVEFAPGAWTLDDAAEQKLQALNKALHERPGLSFEIEGAADPTRDRGRLTRYLLEHGLWKGTGDVVSEEALIALARRRAAAVRDALARAQPDAARRLFLMRPKVAKDAGSRVRLLLKPS